MQHKNKKISENFLRLIYFHSEYLTTRLRASPHKLDAPKVCHSEHLTTQHTNVVFKLEYSTQSKLHNLDQFNIPAVWVTTNGYCQKTAWLIHYVLTQISHSNVQLTLDRRNRSLETGSAWELPVIRSANVLHPPQWRLGGWRTYKNTLCVSQCVSFINLQFKFTTLFHKMQHKNKKSQKISENNIFSSRVHSNLSRIIFL